MTDEQINIAIAEACGWKIEQHECGRRLRRPDGSIANEYYAEWWRMPNYCADLNAMHEAEESMEGHNFELFCNKLVSAFYLSRPESVGIVYQRNAAIHAAARQRAEAFLRTIGKWKD